jgi:hypothetical protein
VNVAVPPGSRSTEALIVPLPAAGQVLPAEAAQVHVSDRGCERSDRQMLESPPTGTC